MVGQSSIDKWSWFYRFLQVFIVGPVHNIFYRKIKIVGMENVPSGVPVILAPNHQNALMDALAFVAGTKFQTIFLARADIFKGDTIIKILTFLKILPVYRIRDGYASLQKNDEIFDLTVRILQRSINPLLLFPEGNHGEKRRLRPLVKGIFRIAFMAQEKFQFSPGVRIIPVGIDYSHYWKFRHTQLIIFGKPIEVADYWKLYTENPAEGVNQLREKLAEEMKKQMIHIESDDYYELYMGLRPLVRKEICKAGRLKHGDLYDEFLADKKLISSLDNTLAHEPIKIQELNSLFNEYTSLRNKLNFRDWVPEKGRYSIVFNIASIVISVVLWPLVLMGIFNNWPHFFIPVRFTKKIRDKQFWSTARWGSGFAILVVYYLALFILALLLLPVWWIKILYILTIPSSGIFAYKYRNFLIKSFAKIRYTFKIIFKDPSTMRFKELHQIITNTTISMIR